MKNISLIGRWRGEIRSCLMCGLVFTLLSTGYVFATPLPETPVPADDSTQGTPQNSTDQGSTQSPTQDPADQGSTNSAPVKDFRDTNNMVTTKGGFMTSISRRGGLFGICGDCARL
jgi:hypothetical protein